MERLNKTEFDAWDQFIAGKRCATIFHAAWWHKAWGQELEIYVRRGKNGEIEAGLPMCISRTPAFLRELGMSRITRPPLTMINGPVFSDCAKHSRCSKYSHEKKEFLAAINSMPRVDFYDFGIWRHYNDLMPFLWNGFETNVIYTYVVPANEPDGWRKDMSENTRRALQSAHREAGLKGCRIEVNPPFEEADRLFRETQRLKSFSTDGYSDRMTGWWDEVKARDAGRTYMLKDGKGNPICATLVVWDSHTMYCLINGMLETMRSEGHLNMLLFERMIMDAMDAGLDFDFLGSELMGVERFIRGWGGELRHYFRVIKITSPLAYTGWKAYLYFKSRRKRVWLDAA
jgi:Acetyltransferase (GNAT) domain